MMITTESNNKDGENTILLVDDEEDIREVLSMALKDIGYRVYTAGTGEEALRIFRRVVPPLVLTDIKMPGMDGIRLLQKIKQENPDTEVIMITGHGDMELAIESFKDEATDFIIKPINVESLEISLNRVHEKIRTREKLREYTENLESLLHRKSKQLAEVENRMGAEDFRMGKESREHIFDELPCFIGILDRKRRLTAVNRRFKDTFGDEIGRHCYAVLKNTNVPCADCPAENTFEDGKSYQSEMDLVPKNGTHLRVLTWTSPLLSSQGAFSHVMVMATEVGQIRELQSHLSQLGLMVGSLSHGIKGMLTGLDGGMYLLDRGLVKESPEQIKEGADVLKLMVGRIKNMILNMLFYAKERELVLQKIDIAGFTGEVARVIASKAEALGIAVSQNVHCTYQGDFTGDAAFLHTALVNILENAVDACVDDRSKTSHRIEFNVADDEKQVTFEVKDDGIGMDADTKEKMFTLFFSAKGKKGTGLGLFITDKIVRQHRGKVSVESAPGEGTVIRITIPRTAAS
jgi:signal transduction histidine kinase/FixJ family two-component response regulator